MTVPAIETSDLTRSFGDHVVPAGVDLHIPQGTVYALLGPNGAGKSTLVHILSTLLRPDAGGSRAATCSPTRTACVPRSG